ncbi:MAG: flavoprotein [Planctomycetota bacterium]|nr:flavoprotein [Planctomycetota bacterium]
MEILLGVSGGVACYKSAMICSVLIQQGHGVNVILTESATRFIGAPTFEALSGRAVALSGFDSRYPLGPHIQLAKQADLFLVAPATANIIAKAAQGIADDLLSTTLLSFRGRLVFAPAMNSEMWNKVAVQRNVDQLRSDGVEMIGPDSGWQSCREQGEGRMSQPEEIVARITG